MSDTPERTVDTSTGVITEDEGPGQLPFAAWFQDLRRGSAHADMTSELADLVEAVIENRKKGTISLVFTVEPAGNGQVVVRDEIVSKPPKAELPTSIYFVDREMNLRREDPAALPFGDLREVPAPEKPENLKEAKP